MHKQNISQALASEEQVRELASVFIKISEAIHQALRELTVGEQKNAAPAYALLTEEYALRSRANMLMIEPNRFARPGLETTQQEMLDTLEAIYLKLKSACAVEDLSEMITSVLLFANSTASKKNYIATFLLEDLKKLIVESNLRNA